MSGFSPREHRELLHAVVSKMPRMVIGQCYNCGTPYPPENEMYDPAHVPCCDFMAAVIAKGKR